MKSLSRSLLLLALVAAPVLAQPTAIIAKARSFLGGDAALNAIKSVHYHGQLESTITSADGETRSTTAEIDIIFAKPFYQRIAITTPEKNETTALDIYEAWQRIENPENVNQWQMSLLDQPQIRRLRANTWENLSFFAGLEKQGGKVIDGGLVTKNDRSLHLVSFDHGYGIVFHRYFDPATGKLVVSETDSGATITEDGENRVAGVRFPGSVTTVSPRADGGSTQVKVVFDKVTVNETFPASLFRVPTVAPTAN
ncbi:hypothetical protein [Actomonas aquatica]|uniref:Uncharacterized protein n=1 Tax=Actomonas aquatica TaxID=2866162 RepID=A0ABZ1CDH0_9BACT|nr:hypothetical protein [Opitutus sp. WL0086]WRQ89646.1 hypothetical protein K1X11_009510 [Opitutus sp. WL0086]